VFGKRKEKNRKIKCGWLKKKVKKEKK